jgi:hypothetical protein
VRQRQPRETDPAHLDFVRGLPCCICGNNIETQAAHVRYADLRFAKPYTGRQEKPHDRWAVPLCGRHHTLQHGMNEREWWKLADVDPIPVAMALALNSGDQAAGEMIVSACRERCAA